MYYWSIRRFVEIASLRIEEKHMVNGRSRIIDLIREAVLDGEWSPGDRLQPMALSRRFDTSTTVVREALAILAGDGLVVARPNQGFFIPKLDIQEFKDSTELRCVAEALGARLATERGDLQWESDLVAAHHRLARTPRRDPGDPHRILPEWAAAHREFHRALLSACGSTQILHFAANLADSADLYRRWAATTGAASGRDVEKEHTELFESALARDGEELGRRLRAHYEATLDVVLRAGFHS